MKIIDEKGKLFGKINIVDFLVIVFFFCLMPIFYFGYKIMTHKPMVTEEEEFVEIDLDCQLIKLKPEVLKLISVGDKGLDNSGQPIGEIISLGESAPYKHELDIGGIKKIFRETTDLKQLKAKLRLKATVQQDKLYYRERYLVKVGLPFEFSTHKYSLLAIPIQEEEEEEEVKEEIVDLYVILKKLDEDTLKMISAGDKETDKDGKTIAEILSLGKIENNSFEINLGGGNFVLGEQGHKKQISAKMRLQCQTTEGQKGGEFYFKGKGIKRNIPFEFKTDEYEVKALVSKSFEEISNLAIKEKWISLQVKFTGMPPEITSAVQKGDLEKDVFGKTAGRINLIITNKPSEALIIKENEFIALNHPFQRDLLLSLNVRCIEKEGVYYFKNYPVKMGNTIAFSTDLYSITGLIVRMEIR